MDTEDIVSYYKTFMYSSVVVYVGVFYSFLLFNINGKFSGRKTGKALEQVLKLIELPLTLNNI